MICTNCKLMADNKKKTFVKWTERKANIKSKGSIPFVFIEWLAGRILFALRGSAIFELLGYSGQFALVISLILAFVTFFSESDKRAEERDNIRKQKHYQAWQVINSAHGISGSGGRGDAIKDLYADGVSLVGLDVSQAYLPDLNLKGADLSNANFQGATLPFANLQDAVLREANFQEADIRYLNAQNAKFNQANLQDADLREANLKWANFNWAELQRAILNSADFEGASLTGAKLQGADLVYINFKGANLSSANFKSASLGYTNFEWADLSNTNFEGVVSWLRIESMENANIYGLHNAPEGFLDLAISKGAVDYSPREINEWKKLRDEALAQDTKPKDEKSLPNE